MKSKHSNMASLDMAAALEKYRKGCSEELLLAVAERLRHLYERVGTLEREVEHLEEENHELTESLGQHS